MEGRGLESQPDRLSIHFVPILAADHHPAPDYVQVLIDLRICDQDPFCIKARVDFVQSHNVVHRAFTYARRARVIELRHGIPPVTVDGYRLFTGAFLCSSMSSLGRRRLRRWISSRMSAAR